MSPANGLICATAPRWTVGLVVSWGVVIDAPPYARKLGVMGLGARDAWRLLRGKGARLVWLPDTP